MEGYLRNVIPFSSVDGPGNRTAIFLQGCNMNCLYCHNPETIPIISDGIVLEGVTRVTPNEVLLQVLPNRPFISGVTISGGECTVQSDFLIELCQLFSSNQVQVFLDTNGLMSKSVLLRLLPWVSGLMFDIKAIETEDHKALTGVDNSRVLDNLLVAAQHKKIYEIRTVVVPEIIHNESTVRWVSHFIVKSTPQTRYKLIKYRHHGVRESLTDALKSPSNAYMTSLKEIAQQAGVQEIIIL